MTKQNSKRPKAGTDMTPEEFLAALEAIGCKTYREAAAAIGTHQRSLIRYATGELPVPVLVERMLHLLQTYGVPKEWRA